MVQFVASDYEWYLEFRVMDATSARVADCFRFSAPPVVPREGELFTVDSMTYRVIRVFHEVSKRRHEIKVTGERI
jgi:hypothetical protein